MEVELSNCTMFGTLRCMGLHVCAPNISHVVGGSDLQSYVIGMWLSCGGKLNVKAYFNCVCEFVAVQV